MEPLKKRIEGFDVDDLLISFRNSNLIFIIDQKSLKQRLKELDNCIENQNKFNQLVVELIDNLDFEDSDSKEKKEEKEILIEFNKMVNKISKIEDINPTLFFSKQNQTCFKQKI